MATATARPNNNNNTLTAHALDEKTGVPALWKKSVSVSGRKHIKPPQAPVFFLKGGVNALRPVSFLYQNAHFAFVLERATTERVLAAASVFFMLARQHGSGQHNGQLPPPPTPVVLQTPTKILHSSKNATTSIVERQHCARCISTLTLPHTRIDVGPTTRRHATAVRFGRLFFTHTHTYPRPSPPCLSPP